MSGSGRDQLHARPRVHRAATFQLDSSRDLVGRRHRCAGTRRPSPTFAGRVLRLTGSFGSAPDHRLSIGAARPRIALGRAFVLGPCMSTTVSRGDHGTSPGRWPLYVAYPARRRGNRPRRASGGRATELRVSARGAVRPTRPSSPTSRCRTSCRGPCCRTRRRAHRRRRRSACCARGRTWTAVRRPRRCVSHRSRRGARCRCESRCASHLNASRAQCRRDVPWCCRCRRRWRGPRPRTPCGAPARRRSSTRRLRARWRRT